MTGIRASQKEKVLIRMIYRTCGSGFIWHPNFRDRQGRYYRVGLAEKCNID